MSNKCCVPGCSSGLSSTGSEGTQLHLYLVPRYSPRRELWLSGINASSGSASVTTITVGLEEDSAVCSLHFHKTDFISSKNDDAQLINPEAVPSIFPQIAERSESVDEDIRASPAQPSGARRRSVFVCQHCPFWALFVSTFHEHLLMKHRGSFNDSFVCSACPFRANYRAKVRNHIEDRAVLKYDSRHLKARVRPAFPVPSHKYKSRRRYLSVPKNKLLGKLTPQQFAQLNLPPRVIQLDDDDDARPSGVEGLQVKLQERHEELARIEAAILEGHRPFSGPSVSQLVQTARDKVNLMREKDQKVVITLAGLARRKEKLGDLIPTEGGDEEEMKIRNELEDVSRNLERGHELRAANLKRLKAAQEELDSALDLQREREKSKADQKARIKARAALEKELARLRFQLDTLKANQRELDSLRLLNDQN